MKATIRSILLISLSGLIVSCAAGIWGTGYSKHEASSVVDYLYPDNTPVIPERITTLNLPIKVGIAFTPNTQQDFTLPEEKKQTLLKQVKEVFEKYSYIEKIEIIPSTYLRAKGGFDNLAQLKSMFGIDVIALVSYDQIQFDDPNKLSFLYWSIVGMYMIKGDQHDTQTMIDTSVFDIQSRKLLFRAPGVSTLKGNATAINYREDARLARLKGYQDAVTAMIPNLEKELLSFKERIKQDQSVQVHHRAGYSAAGSFSWVSLLILIGLTYVSRRVRYH